MAPAAVEDRAAEDERPEISPVDDPEIEDERPELSPVDDPEEDDVDRPKSYTEQLREIKRERDEFKACKERTSSIRGEQTAQIAGGPCQRTRS